MRRKNAAQRVRKASIRRNHLRYFDRSNKPQGKGSQTAVHLVTKRTQAIRQRGEAEKTERKT